ncbi:protein starmaker-like isoform X1 [Salvia divinorum]|uniref:Protein starmaker-like isoform X1 n=1 Tax=Salvia divinorum TaxID=28513 RepID=A0ABD1HMN7_SALDI
MPSLSDKQLEERLTTAGKSLAHPPSSLDELLPLLDGVEELLSKVEQSPPKTMQTALSPLTKALAMEALLEHSDIDVKVGVASCISEITRITAPDAPYDDDKMKDVFQLIVSSFENLSDVSSRSHEKRATILETVAKVRSCVIMLDLECDQMIVDMFQHFLKAISDYHGEPIIANMETIMNLVIEESEDISPDLLAPILATLKKNNQDVTPKARNLAERVIKNSADKLRPYLRQAVTSLKTSFDEYSEVVASVCEKNTGTVGHSNESIVKNLPVVEEKCTSASPAKDPGTPVAQDDGEGTNYQDKDSTAIRSPKSVVSNGINGIGTNEITAEVNTSNKVDSEVQHDANSTFKAESDDCDAHKPEKMEAEAKVEKVQEEAENHDTPDRDVHTSPVEVKPVENPESLDKAEDRSDDAITEVSKPAEAHIEVSKPVEAITEASPAQSGSHPDESLSETEIKETREEKFEDEETVSVDTAPRKTSEEESISEAKKQRHSGKKLTDDSSDKDRALTEIVASKNDDGYASDSEERSLDQQEKPKDASNKTDHGSTLRKGDVKKSGRGKPTSDKKTPKSSARAYHGKETITQRKSQLKSTKHEGVQEETPRTSTKRKNTPGKEKASETREFRENLVGSKVEVWWPEDQLYYEGVIDSFDSGKKKHRVLYNDGDEEILNLKKEEWRFLNEDVVSNGEDQDVEHSSHDTSSDVRVKRKGNMSSGTRSKRQKVEGSAKSKQKDTATKTGGKSKDDGKAESGSKENCLKGSKKSGDNSSKDQSQKVGGKGQVDSAKASGRSKEDVGKNSNNLKQDNLRTPKSKGKTPPGGKTLSSGGARTKSSASKVKEADKMKEKTPDTAKSSETAKGKATDTAKSRESESKVGKKRRK